VERLTGLALIPLGLWFVISILGRLLDGKVTSLVLWLESPLTAALLGLFVVFSFWHSAMGVQVIIEDYIHNTRNRFLALLLSKTLHLLLAVITVLAIVNLHFQPPVTI
jgi:succinate dehydrogenase / fumarate reductase membrane anchor subunit